MSETGDPHVVQVTASTPALPAVIGPFADRDAAEAWQAAWTQRHSDGRGHSGEAVWDIARLWTPEDVA